jgi:hypothetical protein
VAVGHEPEILCTVRPYPCSSRDPDRRHATARCAANGLEGACQSDRGADGVLHLDGIGHFYAPAHRVVAPGRRSLWVRKLPPAT